MEAIWGTTISTIPICGLVVTAECRMQNQIRFDVQLIVPGSSSPNYGRLVVTSTVQLYLGWKRLAFHSSKATIWRTVPWLNAESPAILSFLFSLWVNIINYYYRNSATTKNGTTATTSWYGKPGTIRKATIDSTLYYWHHTVTRQLIWYMLPYVMKEEQLPQQLPKHTA